MRTSAGHKPDTIAIVIDGSVFQDLAAVGATGRPGRQTPSGGSGSDFSRYDYYDPERVRGIMSVQRLPAPPLISVKPTAKKDTITKTNFMMILEIWGGEVVRG